VAPRQRAVPDKADTAEGAVKQRRLFRGWVCPNLERHSHTLVLPAGSGAADAGPRGSGGPCPATAGDPFPPGPERPGFPRRNSMTVANKARGEATRVANNHPLEVLTRIGFTGSGLLHLAAAWLATPLARGRQ